MRSLQAILLLSLAAALSACASASDAPLPPASAATLPAAFAAGEAVPTESKPSPTLMPSPAPSFTSPPPTPTAPPTLTPWPQPTASGDPAGPVTADICTEAQGSVISTTVPSPTLRYDIDTRIYLPPCYAATSQRYPALYLIHGLGFTQSQWERLGMTTAADELIMKGEIAPLIIIMPRDRRDSRLDPALIKDLIPYIDATYRTVNARAARAIGGLSRGGGWAAHLGLKYPETFGRIGLHSPAVFYDDENNILEWARRLKDSPTPVIYIDTGDGDATLRSPLWLDQVFTWFKLNHTLIVQSGSHSERYWSQHVRDYLKFYAADWRGMMFADTGSPP